MITVNGWCAGGMGGGQRNEEMGKDFCSNFLQPFLKTLTEGAVTTEAESLFQYFTALTENVDPFRRRWLATCSAL